MFALVDCNNFYASCERVFQPRLEGKPIVVLSNNDGCIIARSNEAKTLGIEMGAAYYKVERDLARMGVAVFSSNYALYGDLSRRVMQVLATFAPSLEVYSIDECFLDLTGMNRDLTAYGLEMARTVRRLTGIPVSVGIAPTKTLAKLANRMAKKGKSAAGPAMEWSKLEAPREVLAALPVEDVWGISGRWGAKLRALGISTALALATADPGRLRKVFGVVMERTCRELGGVSCLPLELVPPPRQQIMVSRSFGEKLHNRDDLMAAVTAFATRAGEKLRVQRLRARAVSVFIHTSPFDTQGQHYSNSATAGLDRPTRDSGILVSCVVQGLEKIFKEGFSYQRAGVMLLDLVEEGAEQGLLFAETPGDTERTNRLMDAMDKINRTRGRGTVHYASEGLGEKWHMRQKRKSAASTTEWGALPTVM